MMVREQVSTTLNFKVSENTKEYLGFVVLPLLVKSAITFSHIV